MQKGRRAGKVSEAESEAEAERTGEEAGAEAERESEVVGQLRVLECKANASEVLLRALAWKSLGVGASLALGVLAVGLSALPTAPATLGQVQHQLERQMEVIRNIEL